jgi:hypothetical protein
MEVSEVAAAESSDDSVLVVAASRPAILDIDNINVFIWIDKIIDLVSPDPKPEPDPSTNAIVRY